jgi:hypothetical protein
VGCADNTVVIPMRVWDREKSEGSGTRCDERVSRESRFVVHVRGHALTACVLVTVEMPFSSTFSAAVGATEVM